MKKIKLYILSFVFVVLFSLWNFIFAEEWECAACGSAPAWFDRYEKFVKDVVARIVLVAPRGQDLGRFVNPGVFQAGVYKIDEEQKAMAVVALKEFKKSLGQAAWSAWVTAAILWSIWKSLLKDSLGGFSILWQQRPFVMAWKRIMDLDELVNDKVFDLGLAGAWDSKLTEENRKYIEEVFKKYKDDVNFRLFSEYNLDDGVKYRSITNLLLRMNGAMKTFIASNWKIINQFDVSLNLSIVDFSKWFGKVWVTFDMDVIDEMKEGYRCVKYFTCSEWLKIFIKSMKNITKSSYWFNESYRLIRDSAKELWAAFSTIYILPGINDKNISDSQKAKLAEQAKLLSTLYGVDTQKLLERGLSTNMKEQISLAKKWSAKFWKKMVKSALVVADTLAPGWERDDSETIRADFMWVWSAAEVFTSLGVVVVSIWWELWRVWKWLWKGWTKVVFSIWEFLERLFKWENEVITKSTYAGEVVASAVTNGMNIILAQQNESYRKISILTNKWMMAYFPEIFSKIRIAKEQIGTKDSGIIQLLWKACSIQAANKWGLCYPSN